MMRYELETIVNIFLSKIEGLIKTTHQAFVTRHFDCISSLIRIFQFDSTKNSRTNRHVLTNGELVRRLKLQQHGEKTPI